MKTYIKTPIQKVVEVKSIVTSHIYDLREKFPKGESHDFPEIFYVLEGNTHSTTDVGENYLIQGQMIIFGPNVYHGVPNPTKKGTCVAGIISFVSESRALEALYNKVINLTALQKESYLKLLEESRVLFEWIKDESFHGMRPKKDADAGALQNVQNHLELFLLDILQNPEQKNSREHFLDLRFAEAEQYFLSNLHRKLSSQQAAKELNMTVFFLRDLIKKKQNCGITDYFNKLKIEKSKELLLNTPMNVTEIASALGFSSVHYFSRLFKKKTGLSPLQYSRTKTKA